MTGMMGIARARLKRTCAYSTHPTPPSPLQRRPGQPVIAGPSLDHDDLVSVGQTVGEPAALHDRAVAAHLDGNAAVDAADRKLRGQRPDRNHTAHAEVLVPGNAMTHLLAFAKKRVAGRDLPEAPDRLLVLGACL